jgi:hypothetical protein
MKLQKLCTYACCLLMLGALAVPFARADEWNEATKVTFSAPVEVPGRVLPAGTYWFSLMNDDSDRNIVQIWGANRTHLQATILAIPDYRLHATGHTVIHFEERPTSQPPALQAWFYPGDNFGHEFVYPRTRATELAKRIGRPVLSMPDALAADITHPAKSAKEPSVVAMKSAHVKAIKPSGEEEDASAVVQSKPFTSTQTTAKKY